MTGEASPDAGREQRQATTVLVAGTGSHVGKSVVVAGLCRLLADRGVSVAPFKAQNMSNNARVVVSPAATKATEGPVTDAGGTVAADSAEGDADEPGVERSADPDAPGAEDGGTEWGEIGNSQYVQARAARVTPTTDMNPVLLKPRGDGESQLVVHGEALEHLEPGTYYGGRWDRARRAAEASYRRLAAEYDVIVAEGAGSIAEINLRDRDLANIETARFADAAVLLVGDIERGGVFASLWGTLELMPEDVRDQVVGVAINKFRGSMEVLEPGIEEFEAMADLPVLGVLPFDDPGLPAEDSVSLPATGERTVLGVEDGVAENEAVTVGVPRLPFISNFTDLEPLGQEPGVRVAYLPLDASLEGVDAVVLPGSKNTVDDLLAMREAGFEDALRSFGGPIVGICAGYQMLGEQLRRTGLESTQVSGDLEGIGLLPVETTFGTEKVVTRTTCAVEGAGPIAGATGTASGYEIHMGTPTLTGETAHPLDEWSAVDGDVLGTYLHGLFENASVREPFVANLFERAGRARPAAAEDRPSPFDRAARLIEAHVDLAPIEGLETAD